jgi:hypothetical protein
MGKDSESKIIEKYKNELCDNFYTYQDLIKSLNKSIPHLAEGMGFTLTEKIEFVYPEFCKEFLIHLRKYVKEKKDIYDHKITYQIFEQMMVEKIIKEIYKIEEY